MTEFMNIQLFSEKTGISKSALRYYEAKNLLLPRERSTNGYRIYSNDQIATVKLISSLRLADIPIKDIKVYLTENDEAKQKQMMENWINNINKKKDLLTVSLRYLESDSISREIYLTEKSAEQIIWYNAESKIGKFKEHFLRRGNELKNIKIPIKNCYLKYISGNEFIKAQIGFGIPIDLEINNLSETAFIERIPQCICIAMPYQDSIATIQSGYHKLLRYASEHEWTPTSSILEWYHGVDFTELDLLMPVTQIVRRGV
ncbi:MerR family transcriptional regulator [Lysinibacillus fusiformis]|uniref:MerR family transcriptional regulator n=1 Tax=Lysinibacillus fusiformis TaxID=28031 RepID=UPI0023A9947D|nr:MerR family transcriptional regulator [Lysinibacillus fusiformis]WEA37415.1 MerR family transcriptional regulator [Lysinibacillus fusiformis]